MDTKLKKLKITIIVILAICAAISIFLFPVNKDYSMVMNDGQTELRTDEESSFRNTDGYSQEDAVHASYQTLDSVNDNILTSSRSDFAILNVVFLIGSIVIAFLSTEKAEFPILTYVSIVIGLVLFIWTTGFRNVVTVNVFSILYACILAVCIFEYVIVKAP